MLLSVRARAKRCTPEVVSGRNELARLYRRIRRSDPWAARQVARRITIACVTIESLLKDKSIVDLLEAMIRASQPEMPSRAVH